MENRKQPAYFNGAAIIDKHNREIPITESMIENALESIANSLERLKSSESKSN